MSERRFHWPSLVTAAAIALAPAVWAQSSSSSAGTQSTPAASSQSSSAPAANSASSASASSTTSNSSAAQDVSQPLGNPPRQGFWGRIWPFARKKYVKTQLKPIRNRVGELDQLTSTNAERINSMDQHLTAGVNSAQDRANQAGAQAQQAEQQVQQVATQATQLDQQVSTVNQNLQQADQYQIAQTAVLRFRPGVARLSRHTRGSLNQFLQGLAQQQHYVVEVEAYAPGRGLYAMRNSQRLADTVVRYLVLNENVPLYRIYTMGLGNAPMRASSGSTRYQRRYTHGGRVKIRILRRNIANVAGGAPAQSPSQPATQQPLQR